MDTIQKLKILIEKIDLAISESRNKQFLKYSAYETLKDQIEYIDFRKHIGNYNLKNLEEIRGGKY